MEELIEIRQWLLDNNYATRVNGFVVAVDGTYHIPLGSSKEIFKVVTKDDVVRIYSLPKKEKSDV